MRLAIKKHIWDFVAILVIALIALVVGSYILSNQRFYLPSWVPVVGSEFVDYEVEFSTAQAVTPGQGQTIQVAGVSIGEIGTVKLRRRQGRRADEDQEEVHADLSRRDRAAAARRRRSTT